MATPHRFRIMQVITRRQWRGAEVFALQLSDALFNVGHDVLVVALGRALNAAPSPVAVPWRDLELSSTSGLSLGGVRELRALLRGFAPDLVQANGSATLKYSAAALAAAGLRCPLVYRNISIASDWLERPGRRMAMRLLTRRVRHVVAVSQLGAHDFASTFGVPRREITVIPRGVACTPCHVRADAREWVNGEIGTKPSDELLLHVGSFTPEKNHLWLVRAFAELARDRPQARLLLAGDGPLVPQCRRTIAELGLEPRVTLLGTRTDVTRIMAAADLLVLPSLIEGTPGVILEAGVQGTPAVATRVGGIAEVVDDGATGLLHESGDTRGFCKLVLGLLTDASRRRSMGDRAQQHVVANFSIESAARRFACVYKEVLACHTSSSILPQRAS